MDADQIRSLRPAMTAFAEDFRDCFKRSATFEHFQRYVLGLLAALDRKSIEPIALAAGEKADVTLEYKQPTPNAAHLILEWRPPGLRDKIVADTKQWSTYLPEGTDWYNFWTGERVAGGQTDSMRAPISRIPVYVPAGTILPLGPDRQYVGTTSADSLELRVYPGADATYTLYDDAGQGQGYTSGDHVQIPLSWDESAGTLTIGARNGSYPGMLEKRTFRVVMVGPEQGTGLSPPRKPDAAVTYRGEEVTVQLDE
jgi:hypothetical protein